MSEVEEFNTCEWVGGTLAEPEISSKPEASCEPPMFSETARNKGNLAMWATFQGNNYIPCEESAYILPSGQYSIEHSNNHGVFFKKRTVNLDDLLILPDSAVEDVINQIEDFWTKEQHFRDLGFLWKRGVMLWGPPGSGKTSALQLLSARIIERGGISVYVGNPELAAHGLEMMRQIEPNRPLVVMLEDIDAILYRYGEAELLALLDGELQIDNVVFIATTNYPEKLDKRIKNRPSRFDYIKKVGMPSADARDIYLSHKNPRLKANAEERTDWVAKTKGFSIAHLKELIVSVEVFGISVDEAVQRLRYMSEVNISSDDSDDTTSFGFNVADGGIN